MENRYDNVLRKGNQTIIDLSPANVTLRIVLAKKYNEMLVSRKTGWNTLEIGCGEGDLTKQIMKYNSKSIHKHYLLDISEDMIASAKNNLSECKNDLRYICDDAYTYLKNSNRTLAYIYSGWTIHNFLWKDKVKLFQVIYDSLTESGVMLMMDKIYPDDREEQLRLFDIQEKRHKEYIDSSSLSYEICEHERQDFKDDYRMEETQTITLLKMIGFKKVYIVDRVERDVVLIAEK